MTTSPQRAGEFKITHIATGLSVTLNKYFLTEFQDTIDATYNRVATFGRMDPLTTFQGAQRKITVGFEIRPNGVLNREVLHRQIRDLQKMQYPVYERANNALTISRPPLVGVRFANLIRGGDGNELLCAMDGFAFTPRTGFTPEDSPFIRYGAGAQGDAARTVQSTTADKISFKKYSLRIDLIPLHRSPMGFSNDSILSGISDTEFNGRQAASKYDDSGMRFLGGFYFGPHNQNISDYGGPSEVNVFNTAVENEEASIHVIAAADSIFE